MTDAAPIPDPNVNNIPPETPVDAVEQNTSAAAQADVDALLAAAPSESPAPASDPNAIAQTEIDALANEMYEAMQADRPSAVDKSMGGKAAAVPEAVPAVVGAAPATAAVAETAAPFEAPELSESDAAGATSLDMLDDVQLDVKIELGRTHMYIEDVLKLGAGSVVELDKLAGDPVDIYVNERLIARGEVLVLNDNFCVRINAIHNPVSEIEHG